ncbi:centrosome and spindle pole-associated protein 1-like isoform X1 [Entelurus aequoreus]|uniref:centrosome and spindle pole-associated protein 1-like isoform X1 n=1 Tax=Entelurus aequoreus TaxID=161455 RepID=UPI002B1E2950|nr:centrosome and spindle pole-associated protein 1-like isoform X1 [Entelurus aequoreus]
MMELDDELENFIRERKARVAQDRASLEEDAPYMEIRAKPHRSYRSTLKENIPPKLTIQEKEEIYSVGLPLGVEYDKKKKRLQHERRMEYRSYMAQQKLLEKKTSDVLKQQTPSWRDAAALTEARRDSYRPPSPSEVTIPSFPEEPSLEPPRHKDKHYEPIDLESEEDRHFKVKLTGSRSRRQQGSDASYEKTQSTRNDRRENEEMPSGFARQGRRSNALKKTDDAEFATGLLIGAIDTAEAVQKKKDRYRQELQEQIAEQKRNKMREKKLELRVAVTRANDPENQHQVEQFGLNKRRDLNFLQPSALGERESSSRCLSNKDKTGSGGRLTPPPDQPRLAFQSPVMEGSSTMDLVEGGMSSNSQPATFFQRAMDTPRIPWVLPHPPLNVMDPSRGNYGEPHHYYRNMVDPNIAYYGHLPYPAMGLPMVYYNIPPGGAVPSHLGDGRPHSGNRLPELPPQSNTKPVNTTAQAGLSPYTTIPPGGAVLSQFGDMRPHSGSRLAQPPQQSKTEPGTSAPLTGLFPPESSRSTKKTNLDYLEGLHKQGDARKGDSRLFNKIQEQQERKRVEREEQERYEAKLKDDMRRHQPWGRGGGGAPLRDSTGHLIADLSQMHKLNEEAKSHPDRRRAAVMTANNRVSGTVPESSCTDTSDRLPGFTHVQTPQLVVGNMFDNQLTQEQFTQQQLRDNEKYKAELKLQIEEKQRKQAEEREQIRLEEEKLDKKVAEDMARIQRDYEEEQEKKKQKEMEVKARVEKQHLLAEQKRKEIESKKAEEKKEAESKKTDEKKKAAQEKQCEQEREAQIEMVHRELPPSKSTLERKQQCSSRPPTIESRQSTAPLSEQSVSIPHSPPACRNELRSAAEQREVYSKLSALRQQLHRRLKRMEPEVNLQYEDWDEMDSLFARRQAHQQVDVFEMASRRPQAPVRRHNSRKLQPSTLLQIHDLLQLDHSGDELLNYGESRLSSTEVQREKTGGVISRSRWDDMEPRQRSTHQDDCLDISPPDQNHYLGSEMGRLPRGSLLESESAFLATLGEDFPVPSSPDVNMTHQPSARERRRLTRRCPYPQEEESSYDNPFHISSRKQRVAESSIEEKDQDRIFDLKDPICRGNTAGTVYLSDDDSLPPPFCPLTHNRQSSVESFSTDPWMRPGTSETLKCLERPLRREPLTTQETVR